MKRIIFAIACALVLAACGGRSGLPNVANLSPITGQSKAMPRSSTKAGEYLYVAVARTDIGNGNYKVIAAFPATANGKISPSYTITWALGGSNGLSPCVSGINGITAANGRLYVIDGYSANENNGKCAPTVYEVRVYSIRASGQAKPERIINGPHTMLQNPKNPFWYPSGGIAVGADGTLYVGLTVSGLPKPYPPADTPGMLEFGPNATGDAAPIRTVLLKASNGSRMVPGSATSISIDSGGNVLDLYTADGSGCGEGIQEFAPDPSGTAKPILQTQFLFPRFGSAYSLAVNGGNAYVLDRRYGAISTGGVAVYALSGSSESSCSTPVRPVANISGKNTGLTVPQQAVTDANGNVFGLNLGTFWEGHKIKGGTNSIYEFPPTANGNAPPIRTITPILPNTTYGGFFPLTIGRVP